MTANLTVVTAQASNVVVVPTSAIQTTSFGSFVTALDSHNSIVRMPVQTGISDLNNTQILGGLTTGQRIIMPQLAPLAAPGGGRRAAASAAWAAASAAARARAGG